jgi:transposase
MRDAMSAISITRTELSAAELRGEAVQTKDSRIARRLLAIALVMDGHCRSAAAEACAMDRQTLCDWIHRYNERGVPGLADHSHPGPRPMLTAAQEAEVDAWVVQGPDLATDGVVRWRRIDLRNRIEARFGVSFHERSIGKLLRRLNFRRISVRPQHPESDEVEQEAFKKNSPNWSRPPSRSARNSGRSNSGGRTKRASANKVHSPASGPGAVPARAR